MRRIAIVLATISFFSCSNSNEPTRMACEINNTGTIRFMNASTSGSVHRIIWDGVTIFPRVEPGETTTPREESAGVAHTLIFGAVSGQGCSVSNPILIRCQTRTLNCPN